MLSQFQTSYGRVEQSLQRLTDSIAAYNPSPSAAEDLLAADELVNTDLAELITHQRNHLRLTHLRETANSLDETIKSTIRLLADTRNEIQAISSSGPSPSSPLGESSFSSAFSGAGALTRREVNIEDVLQYAKFISKTTVPPTFRPQQNDAMQNNSGLENGTAQNPDKPSDLQGTLINGITTPAAEPINPAASISLAALPAQEKSWLDPAAELPFEPWPSHATISAGALAAIQRMREAGEDPGAVLSAEEQAAAEREREREEDREREEQRERERRRREVFDAGGGGGGRREAVAFNPDDL